MSANCTTRPRALSRRTLVAAGPGLIAGGVFALPATAQTIARFTGTAAGARTFDHAGFDAQLSRRARMSRDGVVRVDYAGWAGSASDRAGLGRYVDSLARQDPLTLSRPEQFAFWANLYNALTIQFVLGAYPVSSIRDIRSGLLTPGPWRRTATRVGGVELSLDNIEHDILRKGWRDPRIHYAVNCASFSCPNLPLRAWRGAGLDAALDAAARAYVNNARAVRFESGGLVVSSIYKWYADDFGRSDARIIGHLARYAEAPLKARLQGVERIARNAYDWSLNAAVET